MNIKHIKIGIIGCGSMAEMFHIPAARRILGPANISIVDNAQQIGVISKKHGIISTANTLSALRTRLDAVIIAAPPHTHRDIALEAFLNGLHVLCEKPLANSYAECKEMLKAADDNGRVFAVCHTYRFFPNRIRIRDMIFDGKFGNKIAIDVSQGTICDWPSKTGYTVRKELVPGGVVLNEALHSLDFLFWVFGMPTEYTYIDDCLGGLESNAFLKMKFGKKIDASYRISRTCNLPNKIRITGERLRAELNIYDMNLIHIDGRGEREIIRCGGKETFRSAVERQLEDFIAAIPDGHPMCPGKDGASLVEFIECCYEMKRRKPLPANVPYPGFMW